MATNSPNTGAAAPAAPATRPVYPSSGGMIVRQKEPVNLEMPFGSLDGFITPVDRFFVRCHFPIPKIDAQAWRLKVGGDADHSIELSYDELNQTEQRTITATLECAGNGRALLTPQSSGAQWERGAVSNAEWTGVPLAGILRRAGMKKTVSEVVLVGADQGEIDEAPRPAGKIHYARSMPLAKAESDVLLALKMNGEVLTAAHGFPVRAIVPGWYGMASVKWLTEVIGSIEPFHGYYQTLDYAYWDSRVGGPTLVPITEMLIKAQIARPEFAEAVCAGQIYPVRGAAWTPDGEIAEVQVSDDGGTTWHTARLLGKPVAHAWRLWDYDWRVPAKPGKVMLMARATDSMGRTQPVSRDEDRGGYMVNHLIPIEVEVR